VNANSIRAVVAVVALAICAPAASPQANLTRAEGRVTDAGKSLPGVRVILSHQDTLQVYRATTDKYGEFFISDVARGPYVVSVLNAAGDTLFRKTLELASAPDAPIHLDIEISPAPAGPASSPAPATPPATARSAKNSRNAQLDTLIGRYDSALRASDPQAEIAALKAIVAADPTRWDYFDALGNVQMNLGEYENAAQSFDKGIEAAQQFASGTASNESNILQSDRDRAKEGMAEMLVNQGKAFLKLKKNNEAIAAYTKAAELARDPATAYFNLCVIHYNTRSLDGALEACDKAIAANPGRADAYFIKGSLLVAGSKPDVNGKVTAPSGTAEALNKYLELAPQGAHANEVKQMLERIRPRAEASGKSGKRP
jgi:tetratricopeptide (TPR) repeat protein